VIAVESYQREHEHQKWRSDIAFMRRHCDALTTATRELLPSEWSEKKRYLPASSTSIPGYYRFDVAPFMREIIDCMSPESPVRHVTIQKGVQIGATTLLENTIGYYIDQVKTAPMMLVTADAELAKLRIESFVVPMLKHSGLDHLVKSLDEQNPRKTGRTDRKYEWEGGGFLIPLGAVNANKLRSIPIQVLLRDEIDGWADNVGRDGDPVQLSADRTASYEATRKIFDCSTPLIKGSSKIARLFEAGDQRRYHVRCLACGHPQVLRWRRTDAETGEITGIVWETDSDGRLIEGSSRYLCEKCAHPHTNNDKTRLFAEGNAEWIPTAIAETPHHRSYHISALYSPVGMQTWDACVSKWLEAWDEQNNRARDNLALQVFYNNCLGEPFEARGIRLRFEIVSAHRRHQYRYGEVPNRWLLEACGSPVLIATLAVDVHIDNLAVAVIGWCRGRRAVLLNYWRFAGDTEQLDNPATWGRLREVIEGTEYAADDGKSYRVQLSLIDCGYLTDTVYRFCERYEAGVYPVRGRESPPRNAPMKEFWKYTTEGGMLAWAASVDMYKDRWSSALRRSWDGLSMQPEGYFNAPIDATDEQLKELTVETRREKIDKLTNRRLGFEWHRPSGANNELWDLLVYNNVALDILAYDVCMQQMQLPAIDWETFWSAL
jgi:phage terminase large subunit GpA-like protein